MTKRIMPPTIHAAIKGVWPDGRSAIKKNPDIASEFEYFHKWMMNNDQYYRSSYDTCIEHGYTEEETRQFLIYMLSHLLWDLKDQLYNNQLHHGNPPIFPS